MKRTIVAVATLITASVAWASDRQPSSAALDALFGCETVTPDAARLACLDAQIKALHAAVNRRSVILIDRENVRRTRRSLFGLPIPADPFLAEGDKPSDRDVDEVSRLDTTINSVAPTRYGLWNITLSEGGTWRTVEADRAFEPRRGEPIVVTRGVLGTYNAKVAKGTTRHVVRVR